MHIPLLIEAMKKNVLQTIVEIIRLVAALLAGYCGATL